MLDWLTYDVAKDFQTLTVGVVGFRGVILTLLLNARLDRQRHERELASRRETVRVALLAELDRNRETLQKNLERISERGFFIPRRPLCAIYESLLDRIGCLRPEEARVVYEAYVHLPLIQQSVHLLRDLRARTGAAVDAETQAEHLEVLPHEVGAVRRACEVALQKVDGAIETLRGH